MSEISIIDRRTGKMLDALEIVLLYRFSETLLPEIFDVIGKEKFIEFLSVFSGMTVKVPDLEELKKAIRDTSIFLEVSKGTDMRRLELEYDMKESEIMAIYKEVSNYLSPIMKLKKKDERNTSSSQ